MMVQFTKDARNRWTMNQFYRAGEKANIPDEYAKRLIGAGMAKKVTTRRKKAAPKANKAAQPKENK